MLRLLPLGLGRLEHLLRLLLRDELRGRHHWLHSLLLYLRRAGVGLMRARRVDIVDVIFQVLLERILLLVFNLSLFGGDGRPLEEGLGAEVEADHGVARRDGRRESLLVAALLRIALLREQQFWVLDCRGGSSLELQLIVMVRSIR